MEKSALETCEALSLLYLSPHTVRELGEGRDFCCPRSPSRYLLEISRWVPGASSPSVDTSLLPCQVNSPGEEGTCSTGAADWRERGWGEMGRKPRTAISLFPLSSERLLWAGGALDQHRGVGVGGSKVGTGHGDKTARLGPLSGTGCCMN